MREAGVGDVGAGDAGEDADEDVDAEEGGDDAAGVEGGVVGDVVEEAAEDKIVGAFVDCAGEGEWVSAVDFALVGRNSCLRCDE